MPSTINDISVDSYLQIGCGRCDKFQTPACKVHTWPEELVALRALVNETELHEEMKWGSPCYTLDGRNVVMISAMRDYCALSFFKGSLLSDPDDLLVAPGPNSQAARLLKFTSLDQIEAKRDAIRQALTEAIRRERAGEKVAFRKQPEPVPAELQAVLDADPQVAAAFASLTPGRQRSHILHVSGAKRSTTRERRAGKCKVKILAGKGFQER